MNTEEMLEAIMADKRDPSIPEYDRLRNFYVVSIGGGGCSGCKLRRIKRSIRMELEAALKPKT